MAPRPTTPTEAERELAIDEALNNFQYACEMVVLQGDSMLRHTTKARAIYRNAVRALLVSPRTAQQFAEHGLTCTTIAEAAQAMEDLSTLARTEAAAKAGALVELGVLRGMIREVVALPGRTGPLTGDRYNGLIRKDLYDRLVAAARTTEGR